MLTNFKPDLAKGHRAEHIVKEVFSSLTDEYTFTDVSCEPQYYHCGDIKATAADGREIMIEVKNDEVIHRTSNVLCEDGVYYKESDYYAPGYMESDYEIYCVVSEPEHKIYVIDFDVLKKIYRRGYYKMIDWPQQYTDAYLVPLDMVKQYNGLIDTIEY